MFLDPRKPVSAQLEQVRQIFDHIDQNGNGYVTLDELKRYNGWPATFDDRAREQIFSQIDTSGDGQIEFEEFFNALSQFSQEGK